VESFSGQGLDPIAVCERIIQGDRVAETEFFIYYERRVRAFVAGRTRDRQMAEEVFQDIMVALLCTLREGRVREPEMLTAYVYGVARNQLMEHFRKRLRNRVESIPEGMDFAAPHARHDESERFHLAEREIAKLDHEDRRILSMTLVDGMKPGEIAITLRMTSEVVRQRKSRALKRLVAKLGFGSRSGTSLRLIQKDG
jgi:RNA polymerase sigma factor (sigma-70 family)